MWAAKELRSGSFRMHPDYYRKLGFDSFPGLVYEGVPPEVFLAFSLDGHTPRGTVTFQQAFSADGEQA